MTSKVNIFTALSGVASDDEDTGHGHKTSHSGQTADDKPKKDRVRKKGPKQEVPQNESKQTTKEAHAPKDSKSRDHELKKKANDLDHPHTLDRKSGTGDPAFANKDKKGGYGKFNKGTFKDDLKGGKGEAEKEEEAKEQEPPQEEEDKTITLSDYLSKSTSETKQEVNDDKAKITDEQLKKELGKATLLQSRKDVDVDDHTKTLKKSKNAPVVGMNTEHAELLGFRTGFKTLDPSKKRLYGDRAEKPGEKQGEKQVEKPAEGEPTKTDTQATEEKKPEEKPAEEDTKEEENPSEQKGGYRGNRRGKGGYRGEGRGGYKGEGRGGYKGEDRGEYKGEDRGGYKGEGRGGYKGEDRGEYKGEGRGGYKGEGRGGYKGENRGEYKGEGRGGYKGENRGGYKGGQKEEKVTFNTEDESLFPKLG